jgi:hypothetical protein
MTEESEKIEAEVILRLHEMSMGGNIHKATFGRLAKEVMPVYVKAITAEFERGTGHAEIAYGATMLMLGMSLAFMSGVATKDRANAANAIIDFFSKELSELAVSKNIFTSDKANG